MRFFVLDEPIHVVAFSLDGTALDTAILLVRLSVDVSHYAASGIFFWFQIPDFNSCFVLFFLCHLFS